MKNKPFIPQKQVFIVSHGSVVGKKEKQGPLGTLFDLSGDDRFGKNTWEQAESEMQRLALNIALNNSPFSAKETDVMFAGDLINQCISSSYGLSGFGIPYLGIFGACSTCAQGMVMASVYASSVCERCISVTSSHYCTAERQFRYPLDYGGQRTPTSQWTVTGAGAFVYTSEISDLNDVDAEYIPLIAEVMPGCITDRGISDANNMGAAMAPAAADTLTRFFNSGYAPDAFDMIITGDLGAEGSAILKDIMISQNFNITNNHADCGTMIYNLKESDTHAGGSGCGCSAVVMASDILPKMEQGRIHDILFVGTGALMNAMALNQKLTIPGIAHLVRIRSVKKSDMI